MSDWRYQYHVDNDSEGDSNRLKRWRAEGRALDTKKPNGSVYLILAISFVFVATIILWSC